VAIMRRTKCRVVTVGRPLATGGELAHSLRFGVTAPRTASGKDWSALCRKVEDLGFATLLMPDHLGDQFAPIAALGAGFEATSVLRMGVLVACNDFRHPVVHAKELATLDVLSAGRLEWGIGAGWLAPEYEMAGMPFDEPAVRVERMQESVCVMKSLFGDGPVNFRGQQYEVNGLEGQPKPVQHPHPPLLIGGAGRRMLQFAAREANVVGIAPSLRARSLAGSPPLESVQQAADRQRHWIEDAAACSVDSLEIHMVAFPAIVTADREARAETLAEPLGLTPPEVLASPHVWLGTVDQIADSLAERRDRFGVSYWSVPLSSMEAIAPVVDRLAGT
jgi:probable F420-dependent oxidoreductase